LFAEIAAERHLGLSLGKSLLRRANLRPPIARHVEQVPDEATEAMHDRGVILPPIAREPTQPNQQRDCRFPQRLIHLIEQPTEIVGQIFLRLCRRRWLRWGGDGGLQATRALLKGRF
jgi:hypothetical protein